jgi:hypothetical protein
VEAQRANLILDLSELGKKLGHAPSAGDINRAASENVCRYAGAYISAFGSLKVAQELAGFKPNKPKKGF